MQHAPIKRWLEAKSKWDTLAEAHRHPQGLHWVDAARYRLGVRIDTIQSFCTRRLSLNLTLSQVLALLHRGRRADGNHTTIHVSQVATLEACKRSKIFTDDVRTFLELTKYYKPPTKPFHPCVVSDAMRQELERCYAQYVKADRYDLRRLVSKTGLTADVRFLHKL